jgi:hypothetical protein
VIVEGEKCNVLIESGVTQMSILALNIFLYYINDIPVGLHSTMLLFPANIIACMAIKSTIDSQYLQQNLDNCNMGRKIDNICFHPFKCSVLSVTGNKNPIKFNYTLRGHLLESLDETKYRGITVGYDIK